jgi:isovaleryl-CoA dehydrogenase
VFGDIVNEILKEEHRILRDTVRKFVRERVEPVAKEMDEGGEFNRELFSEMASLGLTGILIPEEYGGAGVDLLSAIIVLEEIARGSASLALILLSHSVICGYNIVVHGNGEQKSKYLPKLATGDIIGGFAVTEPDAGSDVLSMKTTALLKGDKYILNGSKMFITNGPIGDLFVLYAKTAPEKGRDGISAFIIEKEFPGFSVSGGVEKMGMRGSPTGELYLDDCEVPKENLLGEENKGYYQLTKNFEIERMAISAIATGVALSSFSWQLKHSLERKQFGKLLADFEMIQDKIAVCGGMLEILRTYLYVLGSHYSHERDFRMETSAIKLFTSKNALETSLEAIQILGGYGYTKEYPVERYMRDAKLLEIGAGTSEIMKLIMARRFLRDERLRE